MKKINSTAEFEAFRRKFLLENFRRVLASQSQIAIANAFQTTADSPAPRFWVSEARAAAVIGKMLAGEDPTTEMFEAKKEMYREIFRRFAKIRGENPSMSISEIVFEVVNGAAPKSYLSWHRVRSIIYKEQKRLRKERKERSSL